MADDLVRELGYIALATRLKRISDRMTHSTRLMYKELNLDVEPNWYLVLIIVERSPQISVMDIATKLGFSHQSVISMTQKMIRNDYLNGTKDESDKRRTVFSLTEKARLSLPEIRKVWDAGKQVIYEALDKDGSIVDHLETLESNLERSSFGERIARKIKSKAK